MKVSHCFLINFDFCPLTRYLSSETNNKNVQERAHKFCMRTIQTHTKHSWKRLRSPPSLYIRRQKSMAIETFKIINNLSPTCLQDLLKIKDQKYSFRYSNILDRPLLRSSHCGKKSFRFAAVTLWNSIPNHFRTGNSFSKLKSLIPSWNGLECASSFFISKFSAVFLLTLYACSLAAFYVYNVLLTLYFIFICMYSRPKIIVAMFYMYMSRNSKLPSEVLTSGRCAWRPTSVIVMNFNQ